MSLITMYNGIVAAINNIGLMTFVVLLIIDAILWSIHPVLGTLGALFIFALVFGLISI